MTGATSRVKTGVSGRGAASREVLLFGDDAELVADVESSSPQPERLIARDTRAPAEMDGSLNVTDPRCPRFLWWQAGRTHADINRNSDRGVSGGVPLRGVDMSQPFKKAVSRQRSLVSFEYKQYAFKSPIRRLQS